MNNFFITAGFLIILLSGCEPQDAEQVELIQKFIKSIEDGKSMKDMQKEGLLVKQIDQIEEGESEADSVYSMIIKSISDQVLNCNKMEILDLDRSKRKKHFNENIVVPSNERVYILYCDDMIITRFLIRENKIASFSVMNKGGRKVFLLL